MLAVEHPKAECAVGNLKVLHHNVSGLQNNQSRVHQILMNKRLIELTATVARLSGFCEILKQWNT